MEKVEILITPFESSFDFSKSHLMSQECLDFSCHLKVLEVEYERGKKPCRIPGDLETFSELLEIPLLNTLQRQNKCLDCFCLGTVTFLMSFEEEF